MREVALDRGAIERLDASAGPIIVALSGGGDSTALLHVMSERLGASRLIAGIVDHALRAGSDQDAAQARGCAEALGVSSKVLRLAWPDGSRRAQAGAREARYRALCDLARDAGARVIALGHTRDDQAETVLMRAARGSTWRGLGGMRAWAPAPIWPEGRGVSLARPLLSARREDLRAALRARCAGWIEDPANANTDFARVRARARLAEMARLGFDPLRLAALADQCAPHVAALDRAAAALIDKAVRFDADRALIDPAAWVGGAAVRARALGVLLAAAAGATNEASADQVAALAAELQAPGFKAATLGGGVAARRGAVIELKRDSGALAGRADGASELAPLALPAGRETVWDGRLALTSAEPGWSVVVEAAAPMLVCGEARAAIDAAQPRWLLNERVAHLLAA